jgi:quercetin dioxygenase-like cupin family protein
MEGAAKETNMNKLVIGSFGLIAIAAAGIAFAKGKEATLWPAAEIKWAEMTPPPGMKMPEGAKAPKIAALWGDPMKTAHGALVKLEAGETHPLHTHSADIKGLVLEGTFVITMEGAEAKKLGVGSYFMIPGGMKHVSACEGGCTIFQEGSGKFDMKMVPEAAAKK